MEEEYGVALSLELNDFKKQIANVQAMIKEIKEKDIKIDLDTEFETSDVNTIIDSIENQLEELKNNATGKMEEIKDNAEVVGQDIKQNVEQNAQEVKGNVGSVMQQIKEYLKNMSPETKAKLKFLAIAGAIAIVVNKLKQSKKRTDDLKNSMRELGQKTVSSLKQGIASLKKFALSLFGVQSLYRSLTKAIHSYLAYDQELSKSIQNTWVGLGSFFAPILEYLVSAFQKLLAYINAFVQALTGINFVARANEKALNKMGASAGSTAKAMKQLGSFDELNNINTDTGGGAGGGADVNQIELPEIDTSKLDVIFEIFDRIKYWAGELFAPMKKAWENVGGELVNSITTAFTNIKELGSTIFSSIFEVWTNGTGQQIMQDLILGWTTIFNIIGNVAKSITIAWDNAGSGTNIIQNIADIYDNILKFVNDIAKTIEEWTLTPEFQEMMNTLVWMVEKITEYAKKVMEYVRTKYNEWIKPVLSDALNLISSVIVMIGKIWEKAEPVFKKVGSVIKTNVEPIIKNVIDKMQTFIAKIQGIVDIVTGALAGNWDKVWNGMKKTAKAVINSVIDGINGLINGLNIIATPLRLTITGIAKVTGKNVSYKDVKIPNIPKLSIGTDEVLTEGIAYLHAGEKVVPADVAKGGYNGSDNEETNELLRQLITLIDEKDFEPYIRVDDIGSASVNYINKKKRITGEAII